MYAPQQPDALEHPHDVQDANSRVSLGGYDQCGGEAGFNEVRAAGGACADSRRAGP